jgi:hypothetical protein
MYDDDCSYETKDSFIRALSKAFASRMQWMIPSCMHDTVKAQPQPASCHACCINSALPAVQRVAPLTVTLYCMHHSLVGFDDLYWPCDNMCGSDNQDCQAVDMEVDGAPDEAPSPHSSTITLSELAWLTSLFGFPDLPAPAHQSLEAIHCYKKMFTEFGATLQQQVGFPDDDFSH